MQTPLASLYGAIEGLCELGPEVIKALVIPKIKSISDRIESCIEGPGLSSVDKNGAGHIKTLLVVIDSYKMFVSSIIVILLLFKKIKWKRI